MTGSRILLVEGVPGIGKSTTIDRLVRDYVAREPRGKIRTVVTLAQTHTYGPLARGEDARTLTREESRGRFGSSDDALIAHFQRERDRFREMFDASAMRKQRLVAEAAIDAVAAAAFAWWSSNE